MGASDKKVAEEVQKQNPPANYFAELAGINVGEHMEKKGQFSYLSWAWAVAELRKRHQDATWEVLRFDGVPYMKTELGYFVEVAVTVKGVTLSQIHPVLNARNQPIAKPSPFDINTSIQRCLVKAIALHGLGLYIYAGEDLPDVEEEKPGTITQAQAEILEALMQKIGLSHKKFCEKMKIATLMALPAERFDEAETRLRNTLKTIEAQKANEQGEQA
jgi:hypothetical protein